MRILIVGCGYLGHRVARRWRALGHTVHATTRSEARAATFRQAGLEPVLCDVLAPVELERLPPLDLVLYAVGLDRTAGVPMRTVYVDGLRAVLAALPAVGRLVYISSTSVYGQTQGEEVDETAATVPQEESGRIVLEAEGVLVASHRPAIILRFAGIYGPGRLLRRQAIETGEPIAGDPETWLNLIHVEDGATAVVAAADRGHLGAIYNIVDDQPVRRRDFYGRLAGFLGAPPPRFVSPATPEHQNRRIRNDRMHEELQVTLRFPGNVEGLTAQALSDEIAGP